MSRFQRYIFAEALRAVLIIIGALSILALLSQALNWTELITENGQSAGVFLKVVMLGAPKVLALLIPVALFIATAQTVNRIHKDSEIIVAQATGMTHWQVAAPLLRLATYAAITHLAINLWLQPVAQQNLRTVLFEARTDLATTLIRPGQFTSIGNDLTFYARENSGGVLRGLLISDTRDAEDTADFLAETGRITEVEGAPTLVLTTGEIHQIENDGSLSILLFDQYPFDLSEFLREGTDTVLKASDRYLPQLLRLDSTNYFDIVAKNEFRAEAHYRLTAPLLNFGMVMLALLAILGGDYNRGGYIRRIALTGCAAAGIVILQLTLQAAAANSQALNIVQWLLPLLLMGSLCALHFTPLSPKRLYNQWRETKSSAT